MIKKIKEKYGEFSDSLITEIIKESESVILKISCANKLNSFQYENIQLEFKNILNFVNSIEISDESIVIKDAFFEITENNNIVFDIDPIDCFDYLKENENSKFKIVAKEVDLKNP